MLVVTKRLWSFNNVAAGLVAAGAVLGAVQAGAAPGAEQSRRETASPEPELKIEAPAGYCIYDAAEASKPGLATGFEPGLKSGTELLALFVPCAALEAARAGRLEWLPEWVAVEKNIITYPSDDERSLGTHGAVKQLCEDAQSARWGHLRHEGADFAQLVQKARAKLSPETPEVFLGVIGEEEYACYLSALRIVQSPSGKPQRFLIVTAFMQAGDRWVTQSIRRELTDAGDAATGLLAAAKREAKSFADKNR